MRRKRSIAITGLAILVIALALAARSTPPAGTTSRTPPSAVHTIDVVNSHWAGYMATRDSDGTPIRSVGGQYEVPTVSCLGRKHGVERLVEWTGLGGGPANDHLFQAGTGATCDGGKPRYYAFWEEFPVSDRKLNQIQMLDARQYPVKAGDYIAVRLSYRQDRVGEEGIAYILRDLGPRSPYAGPVKWEWRTFRPTTAAPLSAECILERPTAVDPTDQDFGPLPQFTPVVFGSADPAHYDVSGCSVFVDETTKYDLSRTATPWAVYQIRMVSNATGNLLASTSSSAATSDSFTVTWVNGA